MSCHGTNAVRLQQRRSHSVLMPSIFSACCKARPRSRSSSMMSRCMAVLYGDVVSEAKDGTRRLKVAPGFTVLRKRLANPSPSPR